MIEKVAKEMLQEVMRYRGKGILITDSTVEHIVRLCRMKMEHSGHTEDTYFIAMFKDELKNYVVAEYVTATSIRMMDRKMAM